MSLQKLDSLLNQNVDQLKKEGRSKDPERVIVDYIPPKDEKGSRYKLQGSQMEFIRMNTNSYLSLSYHPALIEAADEATQKFGVGPRSVRFIDGTYIYHIELEKRIARFLGKPSAKIFSSAYICNCGLALALSNEQTYWIGDELNHNSIIRAMRIANVPKENKDIYRHNDMDDLKRCLEEIPENMDRVIVIFDGVFSMRGDYAPIDQIVKIVEPYGKNFKDGIVTVVDDSHGVGAFGKTGRGTAEFCGTQPDIIVGTFGKAFGVNGGFVASSQTVIEFIRQKADTYIYTNPMAIADCAAARKSVDICDSPEGLKRLNDLKERIQQFRGGLNKMEYESIPGYHPVIPVLIRDTQKTHEFVQFLYDNGVLVVGLTYPVVPRGDETIRFQINAAHTENDVDYVLGVMNNFKYKL